MARKFDKYGFEILEDEEPLDYTSIDEDDGDLVDKERRWYEDDDYAEEDISDDEYFGNDTMRGY